MPSFCPRCHRPISAGWRHSWCPGCARELGPPGAGIAQPGPESAPGRARTTARLPDRGQTGTSGQVGGRKVGER